MPPRSTGWICRLGHAHTLSWRFTTENSLFLNRSELFTAVESTVKICSAYRTKVDGGKTEAFEDAVLLIGASFHGGSPRFEEANLSWICCNGNCRFVVALSYSGSDFPGVRNFSERQAPTLNPAMHAPFPGQVQAGESLESAWTIRERKRRRPPLPRDREWAQQPLGPPGNILRH
jgi:hypothetical protein